MLSAAKHLAADRDRPFASLRVTWCDESTYQGLFFTIEPCLKVANLCAIYDPTGSSWLIRHQGFTLERNDKLDDDRVLCYL